MRNAKGPSCVPGVVHRYFQAQPSSTAGLVGRHSMNQYQVSRLTYASSAGYFIEPSGLLGRLLKAKATLHNFLVLAIALFGKGKALLVNVCFDQRCAYPLCGQLLSQQHDWLPLFSDPLPGVYNDYDVSGK